MRNIPENNLAYPLLIKLDTDSSGSGFFLEAETKVYIVTAKHVIYDEDNNLRGKKAEITCQTNEINNDEIEKLSFDFSSLNILTHSISDIACIEIGDLKGNKEGDLKILYKNGVTQKVIAKSDLVHVEAEGSTKILKHVLISNDIFLYGYPTSLGLKKSPQFDYNKPLLRKGIVANIYNDQGTIILDCPVFPGNSGGPVVEVEEEKDIYNHKVIGVVSQFVPHVQQWVNQTNGLVNTEFINSGYSVAISMDRVFETIGYDPDK